MEDVTHCFESNTRSIRSHGRRARDGNRLPILEIQVEPQVAPRKVDRCFSHGLELQSAQSMTFAGLVGGAGLALGSGGGFGPNKTEPPR